MPSIAKITAHIVDYALDVLVTTLDAATGVILAQLGDSTLDLPDTDRAEWWQHVGFASRPAVPTQGGTSCQGIPLRRGDRDLIIATRDTRGTAIYGRLADGETCVYSSAGQGRVQLKADGSVGEFTTDDNTATGNGVFAQISPYFQGPSGPEKGGSFRWYAPWGGQWMDPTGWHLRLWQPGSPTPHTGVQVDFGPNPLPALPGLSPLSQGSISVDYLTLDAAALVLGRDNGTASSLVQATPAQAVMTTLANAITLQVAANNAIQTALVAAGQSGAAAAISAANTAWGSAATALGTISTACATKATSAT